MPPPAASTGSLDPAPGDGGHCQDGLDNPTGLQSCLSCPLQHPPPPNPGPSTPLPSREGGLEVAGVWLPVPFTLLRKDWAGPGTVGDRGSS